MEAMLIRISRSNLYYYDVNSLYPYIMKKYPMPGGKPVWHRNLEGQELSNLYGFIEAAVVCPRTITRPFLPYRDENETLLFPTGLVCIIARNFFLRATWVTRFYH